MPLRAQLGRQSATYLLTDENRLAVNRYAANRCDNSDSGSIPAASTFQGMVTHVAIPCLVLPRSVKLLRIVEGFGILAFVISGPVHVVTWRDLSGDTQCDQYAD